MKNILPFEYLSIFFLPLRSMEFRTIVNIPRPTFELEPCERILFVGSCFADNIGKRFEEEKFRAMVNPFGVMYNPVSVLHTVKKVANHTFDTAVFTLGNKPCLCGASYRRDC